MGDPIRKTLTTTLLDLLGYGDVRHSKIISLKNSSSLFRCALLLFFSFRIQNANFCLWFPKVKVSIKSSLKLRYFYLITLKI